MEKDYLNLFKRNELHEYRKEYLLEIDTILDALPIKNPTDYFLNPKNIIETIIINDDKLNSDQLISIYYMFSYSIKLIINDLEDDNFNESSIMSPIYDEIKFNIIDNETESKLIVNIPKFDINISNIFTNIKQTIVSKCLLNAIICLIDTCFINEPEENQIDMIKDIIRNLNYTVDIEELS